MKGLHRNTDTGEHGNGKENGGEKHNPTPPNSDALDKEKDDAENNEGAIGTVGPGNKKDSEKESEEKNEDAKKEASDEDSQSDVHQDEKKPVEENHG